MDSQVMEFSSNKDINFLTVSQVMEFSSNEDINFLTASQSFEERGDFGYGVNLLPEELITKIFDFFQPYELLKLSEVCHRWNVIIKQPYLWRKKYRRKYKEQPKGYQWFVLFSMVTTDYYDIKPVRRGDADNRFKNWSSNSQPNNTSHFITPVEGFHVTSMGNCVPSHFKTISRCTSRTKIYISEPEIINFGNNRLVNSIVNAFKPVTYLVEWFSCSIVTHSGNIQKMTEILNNGRLSEYCIKHAIESAICKNLTSNWKETPMIITDYSLLDNISFIHVISINQQKSQKMFGVNLIDVEGDPKIFACSLPVYN